MNTFQTQKLELHIFKSGAKQALEWMSHLFNGVGQHSALHARVLGELGLQAFFIVSSLLIRSRY